ncbi:L,D-transpeptidase [Fulvimarina endophytica]|uniref:L,D-transpeptidase n=2 Tax=Fulvimarina endophytica TaxID=2293836 RepID=A0A371X0H6_9HYPH|nr:L,D-transpeptidase [Fulvimarina endophytica]
MALSSTGAVMAQERVYNYASGTWESADNPRVMQRLIKQQRRPDARFNRAEVRIETRERPGTIIVDSRSRYLYLVGANGRATRYGVGVGKEGFGWSGAMSVQRKAEWPSWVPPKEMVARERRKGHILPARMEGGPNNPLGARALYLYRDGRDSLFRIHGTNQPWTIGKRLSSGCIRMMNEDVADLYARVPRGTKVVVIGPEGQGGRGVYRDLG